MDEQRLDNDDAADAEEESLSEGQLASEAAESGEEGAGKRTLGVERWVQLGFMAVALVLVWLLDNVISTVWYAFADPSDSVVTVASVLGGLAGGIFMYRHPSSHGLAHEIAEELARVTWPTRKETSSFTMVVVITSLIAAAVLALFDTVWSGLTDLVYKV